MASLMRVVPELPVDDIEPLQHYEKKLGFQVVMTIPEGDYAIVERDGVALICTKMIPKHIRLGSAHIFATGLDELVAKLQTRGAQLTQTSCVILGQSGLPGRGSLRERHQIHGAAR